MLVDVSNIYIYIYIYIYIVDSFEIKYERIFLENVKCAKLYQGKLIR
jgi:hypothetical protein